MVGVAVLVVRLVPQARGHDEKLIIEPHDSVTRMMACHDSLFAFDPNTADSLSLLRLGFRIGQVRAMLRYRRKGGHWHHPDDFRSLYGLSDSAFQRLRPYIVIDTLPFVSSHKRRYICDSLYWDSVQRDYLHRRDSMLRLVDSMYQPASRHLKLDTVLELNTADTATLQLIKGIGRYTAMQIVRYREHLGGFYSVSQLHDLSVSNPRLTGLDSLTRCFTCCADSVHPIPVNHASLEHLARHPYLTFVQAQTLYNRRRERIHLDSMDDLRALPVFTPQDLIRLAPYLSFQR